MLRVGMRPSERLSESNRNAVRQTSKSHRRPGGARHIDAPESMVEQELQDVYEILSAS